jgi:hypothetical protein
VGASLTVDRSNECKIPTSREAASPQSCREALVYAEGQLLTLTAVEVGQQDVKHLFVPFGDLTNGTETYPEGVLELRGRRQGSTTSTSIARFTRSATTIPRTTARPYARSPVDRYVRGTHGACRTLTTT